MFMRKPAEHERCGIRHDDVVAEDTRNREGNACECLGEHDGSETIEDIRRLLAENRLSECLSPI